MPIAFPTAQGFGKDSIGGRGGTLRRVTNLNDSGAGSFRAAVTASGPRIVVFDVSGTIQLATQVTINEPYLTIAGQTSPGGVQIRGTPGTTTGISFGSGCHDVIIRHLRVRIGGNEANDDGESLLIFASSAAPNHAYNIIIDHCSIEWGHDGEFMVYGNWDNLSLQWNLIAAPICDVSQSTSEGREGMHIGGTTLDMTNHGRISIHHNAFIHCARRVPNLTRARIFDYRCNYGYNWLFNNGGRFGQSGFNWSVFGNIINNHWQAGGDSSTTNRGNVVDNAGGELGGTKIYSSGNWGIKQPTGGTDDWIEFRTDASNDNQAPEATYRTTTIFTVPEVTTETTSAVKSTVLTTVGAYKPSRDSVDTTYVNDAINGTGSLPSLTYAGGPWPTLSGGSPPTDSNNDGIPDTWATSKGLDPNGSGYANSNSPTGWTWLEDYLNELAGDTPTETGLVAQTLVQVSALAETASGNALVPTLNNVTAGNTLVYVATSRIVGSTPNLGQPTNYTERIESGTQNNQRIAVGVRYNVPAGTHSPSISMVTGARGSAFLMEFSGIVTAGLFDTSAAVGNSNSPASGVVTPPNTASMFIGAVSHSGGQTAITPAAGWEPVAEDETVDVGLALNVVMRTGVSGDLGASWTLGAARDYVSALVVLEGTPNLTNNFGQWATYAPIYRTPHINRSVVVSPEGWTLDPLVAENIDVGLVTQSNVWRFFLWVPRVSRQVIHPSLFFGQPPPLDTPWAFQRQGVFPPHLLVPRIVPSRVEDVQSYTLSPIPPNPTAVGLRIVPVLPPHFRLPQQVRSIVINGQTFLQPVIPSVEFLLTKAARVVPGFFARKSVPHTAQRMDGAWWLIHPTPPNIVRAIVAHYRDRHVTTKVG